jgi:ACS family sodium-dependent inorganic phosphate cotransporter
MDDDGGGGARGRAVTRAVGVVVDGDAGGKRSGDGRDDGERRSGYRFVVVALVALALMLCNADRVIMSVASVPLATANGWGERAIGLVQSSFLWGYALTPLVGGVLADRYGGKVVLGFGILVWSLATLATPFAAAGGSLGLLLVTRAVMGLGEGVALPCMNNVISRWVPKSERSRAVAASMGGFQSGSMIGLLAAPALLAAGGIPGPFVLFGALGLVWAVVWNFASSTYPAECSMVNEKELAYIVENPGGALTRRDEKNEQGEQSKRAPPPFKLLLSKSPTWACIIANFVNNWGFFILLAWMPLYFKQVVGLNLREAAWFSALPWATMAASGIVAGTLADNLINSRGWSVTATRKLIQGVGFIGPALCLVALAALGASAGAQTAVTLLTVAVGCTAFTQAGFLVNFQEIGPRYAGVLHGMANTAGSIAGMVGTYVVGCVLEATGGNWSAVLLVTSCVYLIGAATWLAWSTGERVFD